MTYQRPFVRVQKLHEYIGHQAPIFGLCHDEQGHFFSASGDGIIAFWDSQTLSDAKALFQAKVPFYCVTLLQSQILAAGASDGVIYFYDWINKKFLKSAKAHQKSIFKILDIDPYFFITIGGDGNLVIWDAEQLIAIKIYPLSSENLRTAIYEPYNRWLIIGGSDKKIRVFDFQIDNLNLIKEWKAHEPSVFTLVLTKHLPFLVSAGRDASIRVWNYENNFELIHEIPAHIQTINHLQLNPNETYMISVSMDKLIKLWDIKNNFKLIKVIDKNRNDSHTASVNCAIWLEYNDAVITCSDDKKIIQWAIDINPQTKE